MYHFFHKYWYKLGELNLRGLCKNVIVLCCSFIYRSPSPDLVLFNRRHLIEDFSLLLHDYILNFVKA